MGKFLASLLKPLTVNEFSVKDSFDAATRINNIPKDLLESNHKFISFDVESLFTNVPISKTINIILKRIYDDKLISTNLRKRTLKKLILDTCTKTAFTFNNKLYQQKDGVSMGSSLGPVLANIIMTELEETIIQQLIENDVIKFYCRYVVSLIKACINKIRGNCIKNRKIVFKILYDVAKTEVFCNNKDKTSFLCQSNVVYKFVCPGCNSSYVGKTERTLSERTTEHVWSSNDSAIKFHLDSCDAFNDILCIHNMSPSLFSDTWFSDAGSDNHRALRIELVQNNTTIIDRHNNWNILLFKEALKIKELKPCLNSGLKASKELQLF